MLKWDTIVISIAALFRRQFVNRTLYICVHVCVCLDFSVELRFSMVTLFHMITVLLWASHLSLTDSVTVSVVMTTFFFNKYNQVIRFASTDQFFLFFFFYILSQSTWRNHGFVLLIDNSHVKCFFIWWYILSVLLLQYVIIFIFNDLPVIHYNSWNIWKDLFIFTLVLKFLDLI